VLCYSEESFCDSGGWEKDIDIVKLEVNIYKPRSGDDGKRNVQG
jgi:hypothetical protein